VVERVASPFTREALEKRRCTQCQKEGTMMLTVSRYGTDELLGEYCSMECELRSRGISIDDDGIELLLEKRLRGGADGTRTETVE
jgi:hypothetical protein